MHKCFQLQAVCLVITLFFMWGCGGKTYLTTSIVDQLDNASLNEAFEIKPQNLEKDSKCGQPPTLKIIVIENRMGEYEINKDFHVIINPREMMQEIKMHLIKGYELSNIREDDKPRKILQISMQDMHLKQAHMIGHAMDGYLKMEVTIPEINFRKTYEAMERTGKPPTGPRAPAYAIHKVTRQIIDDPEIQKYILCKDERVKSKSMEADAETTGTLSKKLQDLQNAVDSGLITKEEYNLIRKRLLGLP